MKPMIHISGCLILLAGLVAALSSCQHKDLYFVNSMKSKLLVNATYEQKWHYAYNEKMDWSTYLTFKEDFAREYDDLRPEIPDGLRVQIHNEDGSNNLVNLPPEGGVVQMSEGEHSLLMYNNDTEYIVFNKLQSCAFAQATTRTRTRSTYQGNSFMNNRNEKTVNSPDMLYSNYMESYVARRTQEPDVISVIMHPLVFTYLVRYEFAKGLEHVALARGALAGMAESVYMTDGHTSEKDVTLLFDCTIENYGVQALVHSFGVPDFPNEHDTKAERKYALNLEVRMKNGKVKSFDFDVTKQVAAQPRGGVIVVKDIEISDKEALEGNSGFDAKVEKWGEYEDIELPL